MQSLRSKLRKRKYKLSLNRGAGDGDGPTASAFSNAGSEWEFENFSPWIFSSKKPSNDRQEAKEELDEEEEEEQDDEDVKYWGPRPRVQGLVNSVPVRHPAPLPPPPNSPPPPPPPSQPPPPTPPRYGILSYFPRRPSSWSPTSTLPPPVPPHAWQIRRRTVRNGRTESGVSTNGRATSPPEPFPPPPAKNRPTSASHTDLKRSASCYQEPRDVATHRVSVSDSLSDLRSSSVNVQVNGSSSWGARAASRLKRVQSELGSDKQLLRPREPANSKMEPAYSAPYRCRSTNEMRPMRPLRKHSAAASLRHLHNGLRSTLASSESHLSGSYTLLSDDIDRTVQSRPRLPSSPSPPPAPPHRSPAGQRVSPPPPPVPPHAPGVLCTRITSTAAAPVYAVILRGQARPQPDGGR